MGEIVVGAREFEAGAAKRNASVQGLSIEMLKEELNIIIKCPSDNKYELIRSGSSSPADFDVRCPMHGYYSKASGADQNKGVSDLPFWEKMGTNEIAAAFCLAIAILLIVFKLIFLKEN